MIGALSHGETKRNDQQVAAAQFNRAPAPIRKGSFKTHSFRKVTFCVCVHAVSMHFKVYRSVVFFRANAYPCVDYSSGFILELHVGASPWGLAGKWSLSRSFRSTVDSDGLGRALSPEGIPGHDQKRPSAASSEANSGPGHFHSAVKDTPTRFAAYLRPWWLCGPQGLLASGTLHLCRVAFILVLQPLTPLAFLSHIHASPHWMGQRTGFPYSHYL